MHSWSFFGYLAKRITVFTIISAVRAVQVSGDNQLLKAFLYLTAMQQTAKDGATDYLVYENQNLLSESLARLDDLSDDVMLLKPIDTILATLQSYGIHYDENLNYTEALYLKEKSRSLTLGDQEYIEKLNEVREKKEDTPIVDDVTVPGTSIREKPGSPLQPVKSGRRGRRYTHCCNYYNCPNLRWCLDQSGDPRCGCVKVMDGWGCRTRIPHHTPHTGLIFTNECH